jgi:3-hydroxyacyl-CoA dehydrogenase / 3-hydroxy-2-methylbutyryl-CoA dehydrogenase
MNPAAVTAVVTGAASGLGRAAAERLLSAGSRVMLLDRAGSAGPQIAEPWGERALFIPADITREDEVRQALDMAQARWGTLQVLINCAGISAAASTLGWSGSARLEDFAHVIQVNLIGTFNCIRLAAAHMARNEPTADGERGVIINTASTAAFDGQLGQAAYAASKAGIVGMTLPIARDLAELGIRVVTLAPGLFDTPMLASVPPPVRSALARQPLFPKRLGRAEEFAALALHVIENVMLNAETIRLDAGIRMLPR